MASRLSKFLQQLLDARLMFDNVPSYRRCPQELFDGITAATIVFGHDPDELYRVIDAHFEQGPAGVVDLITFRGHPFGTIFGQNVNHFERFTRMGSIDVLTFALASEPIIVEGPLQIMKAGLNQG